jgi:galactose mutarotase-like enzyme
MNEVDLAETAKENVLIQAGECSVTILPQLGGKIASIRVKDRELLQAPLAPIGPRTRSMSFDSGDASGWDECLPSVAGCRVETADGLADVPDHGDLWRVAWTEIGEKTGASLALAGECYSLPLALERSLVLSETTSGWRLSLRYTVTNTGRDSTPWSWSAHPSFAAEAGDRILLPDSIRFLRLEGSGGGRLGKSGDAVTWPTATLVNGSKTDLSVAKAAAAGIGDKLFAGPLSAAENWCALERPRAGVRIRASFDAAATPYLGLWICFGGWPERPGPKQMCVALEPTTAPVDSLAVTGPWSRMLQPMERFAWPMNVEIESISKVNENA